MPVLSLSSSTGMVDNGGAVSTGSSGMSAGSMGGGTEPGSVSVVCSGPNVATVASAVSVGAALEITSAGVIVRRASPAPMMFNDASPGSNSAGTTTSTWNS